MAEAFVQVSPDGGGKQIDAQTVADHATGNTLYRQTITVGDPMSISDILGIDEGMLQNSGQTDRVRLYFIATASILKQNQQRYGGVGNGFIPIETPDFLAGV